MSLWYNAGGWCAPWMCLSAYRARYDWLWNYKATQKITNEQGETETVGLDVPIIEATKLGASTPNVYVHIDGYGDVVVLKTTTSHYYDYYHANSPYHDLPPEQHPPNTHTKMGDGWCGNNPMEPFIVPPGTPLNKLPAPVGAYEEGSEWDVGNQCFIPKMRCSRLFLVQNAVIGENGGIDFTNATYSMIAHGDAQHEKNGANKLLGKDRINGIRPLHYKRGAGGFRQIIDHRVSGNWSMDDFFFPPIENEADKLARNDDIYDADSPVFAPFTDEDGITHPCNLRYGADDFRPDWPKKWPTYIFTKTQRIKIGSRNELLFFRKTRFWNSQPQPIGSDISRVKDCFETTGRAREIWNGDVGPLGGGVRGVFPVGTAFDMVVAVRTWYAYRYIGAIVGSWSNTSQFGVTYQNHLYKWVPQGKVYLESQVAGYWYQLSETNPKQRGA